MAKAHEQGWEVGQTVYVVFDRKYDGHDPEGRIETITKIGRRWIEVGDPRWRKARFDAETMILDGGNYSSPGRIWPSEAEYRESLEVQKAWRDLVSRLPWQAPNHFTVEDVKQMRDKIWEDGNG